MSSIKESLQNSIKDAMRAKEKERLGTLRFISAALKQAEIDGQITLDDPQTLNILNKLLKQRQDAAKQYTDAERPELADKENYEAGIIKEFLPEPLDEATVDQLIAEAISSTQATEMKDMGKVMGILKAKTEGRADMGMVSKKIKALLS